MTDGLAETIIRDSLNEFDDRIMERKISNKWLNHWDLQIT